METVVIKLEALFQKAEADLDYIQHKLELEIMRSLPHDAPAEENPIALLKEIPVLKSRYKSLCVQMDEISMEQKKSMENIQATLDKTMKTVQTIQQRIGLESSPLSAEEQAAAHQLNLQIGTEMGLPVKEPSHPESAVPDSDEKPQFKPLTEEAFMSVPRKIRSTVKLEDLNCLYKGLFNHFVVKKNTAALSVSKMNRMNMKATHSRIQVLEELGIVELNRRGDVKLVV